MIRPIYTISVYIATLIMMLHSLVPHEHHDQMSLAEHELEHLNISDPISWLKTVFHNNMGADHLEVYESVDAPQYEIGLVDAISATMFFDPVLESDDVSSLWQEHELNLPPDRWRSSSLGRRGPPCIS